MNSHAHPTIAGILNAHAVAGAVAAAHTATQAEADALWARGQALWSAACLAADALRHRNDRDAALSVLDAALQAYSVAGAAADAAWAASLTREQRADLGRTMEG